VKQSEDEKGPIPYECEKVDEFSYNVLVDMRSSLQSWMQNIDKENYEKTSESVLYDILNQTLGWWATALTLESLLGKRAVNKRTVKSVAKARLNTSTIGISTLESSSEKNVGWRF
jgi:ribosome biogenesis GTPase A